MAYSYGRNGTIYLTGSFASSNKTGSALSQYMYLYHGRTGSRVENYRRKIQDGLSASSYYYTKKESFEITSPPWGIGQDTTASILVTSGSGSYFARPATVLSDATLTELDKNLSLSKLHDGVADALTRVQTLPFVAEFAKTKQMSGKLVGDLLDNTIRLKRTLQSNYFRYKSLRNGWKRFTSDASSRYLEWKFGVAPLMHDISSAVKELSPGSLDSSIPTIRSKVTVPLTASGVGSNNYSAMHIKRTSYCRSTASASYYLKLNPQMNLQARWGLNPGSIPGAIWEVTPWSWLVDYFLNVQTFLNQWQYLSMPIVYGGYSSKIKSTVITAISPGDGVNNITVCSGVTRLKRLTYTRSPFTSIPMYIPSLNLAGPFVGAREWNIAALIGTKFKRF